MRKIRKIFTVLLAFAILTCSLGTASILADDDVKPVKVTIAKSSRTLHVGDVIELKAKTYPYDADDDYLRWSIVGDKGIVKFHDNDRYDDDIKIKGLKTGVTKIACYIKGTSQKAYVTVTVKEPAYTIKRVGKAVRTIESGDDFELKVRKSGGLRESQLKWSIKNTKIVKFDDNDRYGTEVEFKARRTGTTTITCTNTKTKKTITYTVKVVPDDDDDDYDDD